jgi:glycosidase
MSISTKTKMEFHLSRRARDFYNFDKTLFSTGGNVIFADFYASRIFARKMNQKRDLSAYPEKAVKAGQINAMGLIDEILHLVMEIYRSQTAPEIMTELLDWLNLNIGKDNVDLTIKKFTDEFPPLSVYNREISVNDYIMMDTDGYPNRMILLEEMLMLWLENANPAFNPYIELFDDSTLRKETSYLKISSLFHKFFQDKPFFGPDNQNIIDMLRSPAIEVPYSLSGQIEYIRKKWGFLLKDHLKFFYRLLTSQDLISEEEKPVFGFGGQGPARVLEFKDLEIEKEKFSPDKDWMPRLVLLAKNAYVWLDQLSKKYKTNLTKLSDIPDRELDLLAAWGITGLWLIGLWERSQASKNIKIMRGNPEAVASAYSLYDYQIASDLGGEEAYQNLNERTRSRGIRLSSDMVPNHMGIDSKWVIDHPDWFIRLDYPPYPAYTFNGPNFSPDERVGIYIEDHYFNNTDAAVVFKRVDFHTGDVKYIYHGNDGTSMPWNDTAQLNFLRADVREAVIQTILYIAKKFSVIRFDAAMTLAKRHFQRLWFPEPGTGGAIPSRAEFGMTKEEFEMAIPVEFWREVVDRVALEVPDTLLLAEAFWLMEGYFVRTLGMHRVYNSAFMNMLRDEKNAEYRLVMKNTLEFDTEILRRYVNFMNNPDEYTAVEQFGKGDKYFGICTLLATMPGLPMIGHGQIEGFTEKYGMEYRRAYLDETPDQWLIERHIREVFPLFRKRYLFAEVKDFLLYDLFTEHGYVDENVFAYSNKAGNERSLVVYHNKYSSTKGWIKTSAAFAVKTENGDKHLMQKSLFDGLGLDDNDQKYVIFRDHFTNLEYIRSNREIKEKGFYIEIDAYKSFVFVDFREELDNHLHQYHALNEYLRGNGTPSIKDTLKEIFLQPVHYAYRELINYGFINYIIDHKSVPESVEQPDLSILLLEINNKVTRLLLEIKHLIKGNGNEINLVLEDCKNIQGMLNLPLLNEIDKDSEQYQKAAKFVLDPDNYKELKNFSEGLNKRDVFVWSPLILWLLNSNIGKLVSDESFNEISRSWIEEWLLGKIMTETFKDLGFDGQKALFETGFVKLLIMHGEWWEITTSVEKTDTAKTTDKQVSAYKILKSWLEDREVQQFLGINRYQDILWFNKESLEKWLWWMFVTAIIRITSYNDPDSLSQINVSNEVIRCYKVIEIILSALELSEYKVEKLLSGTK